MVLTTLVQHVINRIPAARWLVGNGKVVIVNSHIMHGVYHQEELESNIEDIKEEHHQCDVRQLSIDWYHVSSGLGPQCIVSIIKR